MQSFRSPALSVCALRWGVVVALLTLALPSAPAVAARGLKTGPYVTTFAERSPLGRPRALAARMSLAAEPPDYDLTAEPFLVVVPDTYDPDKPAGILYLVNYKDTEEFPRPNVQAALAKRNLIFAMSKTSKQPVPTKVGMALDVVHNLKRRYEVDPARVYVFDFDVVGRPKEAGGTAGYWLALGSADVFTGSYHHQQPLNWRPARASNGGMWPPMAAVPPDASLAAAKSHPFVMTKVGDDEWNEMRTDFLNREGFAHTKRLPVSTEQCHYPALTLDWFEETLTFLDGHAPKAGAGGAANAGGGAGPAAAPAAAPAVPVRTGSYTTTFSERSPLSEPKALAARLSQRKPAPDYDLSKEAFLVYVPEDYSPAKPAGLLYLLNYKQSEELPTPVLPVIKQHNLILAVAKSPSQVPAVKVGMGLDLVHNFKKQYAVDPTRIYVFDFDSSGWGENGGGSAGQWLALGSADVFTGSFHVSPFLSWKPLRAPNNMTYPARSVAPPAASFGLAHNHPIVLSKTQDSEFENLGVKFAQQQGFKHLKLMNVTMEQRHYPNYTTDWVEETLTFLDANVPPLPANLAATPAATTTRPVVVPPAPTAPGKSTTPAKPAAAGAPAAGGGK